MRVIAGTLDAISRIAAGITKAACVAVLFVMLGLLAAQVVARYVFNWPVGWTVELQSICWLWLILWASALVLRDQEEIRFDIVYAGARPGTRRVFRIVSASALVALYGVSLPAAYDYVSFMKIEKSPYLDIPYDWLFSIYIVFAVGSILRYLLVIRRSLAGPDPDEAAPVGAAVPGRDAP